MRSNKLLAWCRRITANREAVRVDDMSSSWRSGLALCAIIHQFRPDLIKWEELNAVDIEANNQLVSSAQFARECTRHCDVVRILSSRSGLHFYAAPHILARMFAPLPQINRESL